MRYVGNTNLSQLANDSRFNAEETGLLRSEVLKLTFEVFIALFGVIGNFLVVIVLRGLGKKKKPTEFYVQNLAIADLGTLLLAFPLVAIRENEPWNWPFGEFTCLYLYPVPEIFYGASVWFIAVIAIERYRKITVKVTGQIRNTILLKRAKIVAAGVWVISFLGFCLPLYFTAQYSERPNGDKSCGPFWLSWVLAQFYLVFLVFFSYIIPLVLILFTYLAIMRAIIQSSVFIDDTKRVQVGPAENRQCSSLSIINRDNFRLKQNERAKKLLTPLVLVFAVTMLPLNILRLTVAFWPTIIAQEYYRNLMCAVTVSAIINSSANPVIYFVISREFRQEINNHWRAWRR